MKIEIGKFYKTRDGRKAVATKDDGTDCYPVIVEIGDAAYYHNRDGSYLNGERNNLDLIAEWVEPIKLEVGKFYKTRDGRTVGPMERRHPLAEHDGPYVWQHDAGYRIYKDDGTNYEPGKKDLVSEAPSPALSATANDHIVAVKIGDKPAPASKPFVHSSREAAITEARRLAALNPGSEFAVYQRVTAVTAELVMREAA